MRKELTYKEDMKASAYADCNEFGDCPYIDNGLMCNKYNKPIEQVHNCAWINRQLRDNYAQLMQECDEKQKVIDELKLKLKEKDELISRLDIESKQHWG